MIEFFLKIELYFSKINSTVKGRVTYPAAFCLPKFQINDKT